MLCAISVSLQLLQLLADVLLLLFVLMILLLVLTAILLLILLLLLVNGASTFDYFLPCCSTTVTAVRTLDCGCYFLRRAEFVVLGIGDAFSTTLHTHIFDLPPKLPIVICGSFSKPSL